MLGGEHVIDPFSPIVRGAGKEAPIDPKTVTREPDQDRETELKRQAEKEAILERRAARRKSMANRRVSFAPEATLHTWSVMELAEDSTSSSASNSTRRQSSMTAAPSPVKKLQSPTRSSSTPPALVDQTQEGLARESPDNGRGVLEKKRQRRSSGVLDAMLDASHDDVLSSSPSGDVSGESSPIRVEEGIESDDDGSEAGSDTAMSIDEGTSHTVASQESESSTQSSLDERLQRAAHQAGTRGIEFDEHGDDLPMEMVTGTITRAFQPWAENAAMDDREKRELSSLAVDTDQIHEAGTPPPGEVDEQQDEDNDISMDVTKAVGSGIISHQSPTKLRRPSTVSRRRSSMHRRRSSADESAFGDETMDLTTVQGGILSRDDPPQGDTIRAQMSDEDMTMEFTNVLGVPKFTLGTAEPSRLHFEDPKQMESEVDAERAEEQRRESGRFVMEQEADENQEENATLQLKEMIESMTPKKSKPNKIRGRKSLAVGGAKGLLGKRPAELDMDDDDDDEEEEGGEGEMTPKRQKTISMEGSPVKKIHLPKPPSKDETTGRLPGEIPRLLPSGEAAANRTPMLGNSPTKAHVANSPAAAGRFKDVSGGGGMRPTSFEDKLDNVIGAIDVSTAQMQGPSRNDDEKISLQSFLNMTNIHFIDLSTTKRRHTLAQPSLVQQSEACVPPTSEANFVAAATTLPLLELYQHATRELKSYISTGRKIVRSIEAETLEEQPPLFREYVDARPDIKLVMDNQFRNGKANARLQSREGWYTWRTQLVEGLKSGLEGIKNGMRQDVNELDRQQQTLDGVVPQLVTQQSDLDQELKSLQQNLAEIESVDHEALNASRNRLQSADEYNLQKSILLDTLQQQMRDKDEALAAAAELKSEMEDQIAEANRVRDECRGWPAADVMALKARVDHIEKLTGWRLVTAEEEDDNVEEAHDFGVALTLTYQDDLRLFFYPSVFQCNASTSRRRRSGRKSRSVSGPTAPISLVFMPKQDESGTPASDLLTEQRFFLQLIRSQLHVLAMMPKGSVSPRTLLLCVAKGWDIAGQISEEIRMLNMAGVTTVSILGDEKLGVKVMLMLSDRSRIDIGFIVSVTPLNDGEIIASTTITAHAVYGPITGLLHGTKARKVQQALGKEVESKKLGHGAWIGAVQAFEEWVRIQRLPKPDIRDMDVVPVAPVPARSPLAPKKTNNVQKKALPVPKQRHEKFTSEEQQIGKENMPPASTAVMAVAAGQGDEMRKPAMSPEMRKPAMPLEMRKPAMPLEMRKPAMPLDLKKPAISPDMKKPAMPPEMQEAMMHTPIKRVGALRRSPI